MNRRSALLSVAGAGLAGTYASRAAAKPAAASHGRRTQVVARDGTRLFHRDWGDGKPMVFLIGWTLTSESWAYQAAELSDQGFGASPTTGAAMAAPTTRAGATTWTPWPTTWPRLSTPSTCVE